MPPDHRLIASQLSRESLLESARARAHRITNTMSPDGSWAPVAFVVGTTGAIAQLALCGADWAGRFLQAARPLDPRAVCLATTAWLALPRQDEQRRARIDPEDAPRASARVHRSECVVLHAADPAGLSTQIATIKRSEHQPPQLGAFGAPPQAPALDANTTQAFTTLFGPGWLGGGTAANKPVSAEQLQALHEHLAEIGGAFDGEGFCAFVAVSGPQPKTIAVISCEPSVYELSCGKPTGVTAEAIELGSDLALRVRLTLFDDPHAPAVFAPLLNPAIQGAREMISQLAQQPVWELVFLNCADGSGIGTRYLPGDQALRDSLRDVLLLHRRTPGNDARALAGNRRAPRHALRASSAAKVALNALRAATPRKPGLDVPTRRKAR